MATAPLALGDIVQVILELDVLDQTVLNVLHYKCQETPDNTDYAGGINDLIASLKVDAVTNIIDNIQSAVARNCRLNTLTVQRVYPTRSYYIRNLVGLDGQYDDDCTASNVAAVINKQSERSGRGRHGSFHLGGIPSLGYSGGNLTAAYITLMDNIKNDLKLAQMQTLAGVDIWFPGLFNPKLGVGLNWSEIVTWDTMTTLRVMRRRTLRVGI